MELIRGVMLIVEAAILEPKTQISGANVLIDLVGLSLNHVWQFSPSFANMLLEWVQVSLFNCFLTYISHIGLFLHFDPIHVFFVS